MKKNVKYVKNVLDKIKNDAKVTRERLFYSIGVLSILLLLLNRYNSIESSQKIEENIETNEVVIEKVEKKKERMSFKEKFKRSRAFHGPNGLFMWNGKTYHCKYKEEMKEKVDSCQN